MIVAPVRGFLPSLAFLTDVENIPNPTNGMLNIASQQLILSVELQTVDGKIIERFDDINNTMANLNLQNHPIGFYLIRVYTPEEDYVRKVIIGK